MGHTINSQIPVETVAPGMTRQIMGYDKDLMLVKVNFEEGAIGYKHKHPHQQVSYVVNGKFEVEIAGIKEILGEGDCFVVPENSIHGVVCLKEGILIDTFSPMREDFVDGKKLGDKTK